MEGSDFRHGSSANAVNALRFFLPMGTAAKKPALPRRYSCAAALLPEEAFFDFRINRVEPLLCALCSVPVLRGFRLQISNVLLRRAQLVSQLLGHIQRLLAVLFGYTRCFLKQIENRMSRLVELIVAFIRRRKRNYGFFCLAHV